MLDGSLQLYLFSYLENCTHLVVYNHKNISPRGGAGGEGGWGGGGCSGCQLLHNIFIWKILRATMYIYFRCRPERLESKNSCSRSEVLLWSLCESGQISSVDTAGNERREQGGGTPGAGGRRQNDPAANRPLLLEGLTGNSCLEKATRGAHPGWRLGEETNGAALRTWRPFFAFLPPWTTRLA